MSRPHTLPLGLTRIAEVIGEEKAILLGKAVGGVEHYIPRVPKPDHEFTGIIGMTAFTALCAALGSQTLEIPKGTFIDRKKLAILDPEIQGLSERDAARTVGVTGRYVRAVRAQSREAEASSDCPQGKLPL